MKKIQKIISSSDAAAQQAPKRFFEG